jgi:hypothetical protein
MSTTNTENYYEFYFKLAYTCQTQNYLIDPNLSITNFIDDIKNIVPTHFDISPNEDIEIVEVGQPHNINGRDAELAPALKPTDLTIKQLYEHRYRQTAFYIRKIHRVITETPNEIIIENRL